MATTLSEKDRIAGIRGLHPTGEKKLIHYNDTEELYDVYDIPLEFLIYNPHNGRIRSLTKSFESQHNRNMNPEAADDKITIEQFLYDSARNRNDRTIESIEQIGQKELGIVTNDGVIIDGNRRAMILNLINKKNKENRPFRAIVLKDNLRDKRKEIIALETSYQMGVDSKVDYNPIEKYIRCNELLDFFSIEEIAEKMAEDVKQIREWLNILKLMEEYLIQLGTPGRYTRLEKREGHFVDLIKYLRSYESSNLKQSVNWEYSPSDIIRLKNAYFTYVRLAVPVARTRIIARPSNSNSFFCYKEIWDEFVEEYESVTSAVDEVDIESLKLSNPQESDETLVNKIDEKWRKDVGNELNNILVYYEGVLVDRLGKLAPLRLLKRAKSTLGQIDIPVLEMEMDDEKRNLIIDLDNIIQKFKQL